MYAIKIVWFENLITILEINKLSFRIGNSGTCTNLKRLNFKGVQEFKIHKPDIKI